MNSDSYMGSIPTQPQSNITHDGVQGGQHMHVVVVDLDGDAGGALPFAEPTSLTRPQSPSPPERRPAAVPRSEKALVGAVAAAVARAAAIIPVLS